MDVAVRGEEEEAKKWMEEKEQEEKKAGGGQRFGTEPNEKIAQPNRR